MTLEIAYVLLVLLAMSGLFLVERLRMDVVGFLALTCLLLGGVLSVGEALAGFSDPTVHMIAGLFVVGGAIFQTGLADRIGLSLERMTAGKPGRLLATLLLVTAGFSAFLSSTGTIAMMIPVAATLSRRSQTSPSKFMIPLAFATLLGGMLTLIATPPNMIVSAALVQSGREPFAFFDFTGPGICLLGVGLALILLFGPRLLPDRMRAGDGTAMPSAGELWARYGLADHVYELEVQHGSPLIGRTIADSAVRSRFSVGIFAVEPHGADPGPIERARADRALYALDRLTVKGTHEAVAEFCTRMMLRQVSRPAELPKGLVVAELLIPPGSSFVGKTVAETRLRTGFDIMVMAVFRSTAVVSQSVAKTVVLVGDLFLLLGTAKALSKFRDERRDVILVTETEELRRADFRTKRAPHALIILTLMLAVMTAEIVPPVLAVICAALAMVLTGCVDGRTADKHINWESLLLIATILPFATALTKTGAIALIVSGMVHGLADAGPYVVMSSLFLLTSLVGLVISNTATAVLIAPIGIEIASSLALRPEPLVMAIAIASSAAFLTPVSSPVNMLVMNAGGYRFGDFARLGAPLLVLTWLVTLLVVPWFFPFAGD